MNLAGIFLIVLALLIVFWIAPSVMMTFCLFYGHWDESCAMNKAYLAPWQHEMEESISCLEALAPQQISITARDRTSLSARWFDHGSRYTVILLHGFKASAYSNCCIQGKYFWEKGFNLLLVDQRAHGRSGGKATTFGLVEQYDLMDWIDWCRSNTATGKIVCYGVSMGSAAVAYASSKLSPDVMNLMILDCGFSSPYAQMDSVAKKSHIPWRLMAPLVRPLVKFLLNCDLRETVHDALEKTSVPAFFLHGTADDVVNIEQGRKNYQSCKSKKDALFVEGAQHTTAFVSGGTQAQQALSEFIEIHVH